MKPIQTIPGYQVCEYVIVLSPHEELNNKIIEVRDAFNKNYKVTLPVAGKANVLLATFTQFRMMEERILNRLKRISMGFPPFKVELKDFGSFPTHTLYINVTSKLPVQNLVKQIRSETQSLMKFDDDNKPYFSMEPHITIARKLKPWQYEKGWLELSSKHFTGRFIASDMLLLKRNQGDKNWHVAQRFEFENLPVATKQGDLFG
jgi:2'-5' RNA ligase